MPALCSPRRGAENALLMANWALTGELPDYESSTQNVMRGGEWVWADIRDCSMLKSIFGCMNSALA